MKSVSGGTIAGDVQMIAHKANGEVSRELRFSNLVLDVGYKEWIKRMASGGLTTDGDDTPWALIDHLYMGTGTTEPAFLDNGLENRSGTLAGKNTGHLAANTGHTFDRDNDYYEVWYLLNFEYAEGQAEGVWTEIGLADLNYAFPFTRALIRDETGQPTSLTILSDEFLTVKYTLRFISEPQDLGTVTVNGQASAAKFIPGIYHSRSTYQAKYRYAQSYLPSFTQGSLRIIGAVSAVDLTRPDRPVDYNQSALWDGYSGPYSGNMSYASGYLASGNVVFDPTNADEDIACINFNCFDTQANPEDDGIFGFIVFDPYLNKRADYRLTLDIDIDFTPQDGPVTGLAETAAATSLDFTWDAYPNTTEYQLVLRQAGTVIEEQTVTAPTVTANFTGLTASTEYHLDIKPIATPRNGRRLIHAASTTA